MAEINSFYSTFKNPNERKEFQIQELSEETHRGTTAMFSDGKGNFNGGESISSRTTSKDYDEAFVKELLKIDPPYLLEDFINYHYTEYLRKDNADPNLFLKHIKYVIYELIKKVQLPHQEILLDWIEQKKTKLESNTSTNSKAFFNAEDRNAIFYKLDELLERITNLELGQQITYDDLNDEISELKELTHKLNKKNWSEILKGKMLTIGLGRLTNEGFDILASVFSDKNLIK